MQTTELIGLSLFAIGLLAATAQFAFGWGEIIGARRERQLADKRVQGVLDYENRRRPSPKSKRKATRKRAASSPKSPGLSWSAR